MAGTTLGTNHSGGDAKSGGTNLASNEASGSFNTNLDLSSLQTISGHTINDGLDAQETATLFSAIAGNAVTSLSNNAKSVWNTFINSTGFKIGMACLGGLIAYFLFFRKGRR